MDYAADEVFGGKSMHMDCAVRVFSRSCMMGGQGGEAARWTGRTGGCDGRAGSTDGWDGSKGRMAGRDRRAGRTDGQRVVRVRFGKFGMLWKSIRLKQIQFFRFSHLRLPC